MVASLFRIAALALFNTVAKWTHSFFGSILFLGERVI